MLHIIMYSVIVNIISQQQAFSIKKRKKNCKIAEVKKVVKKMSVFAQVKRLYI